MQEASKVAMQMMRASPTGLRAYQQPLALSREPCVTGGHCTF